MSYGSDSAVEGEEIRRDERSGVSYWEAGTCLVWPGKMFLWRMFELKAAVQYIKAKFRVQPEQCVQISHSVVSIIESSGT